MRGSVRILAVMAAAAVCSVGSAGAVRAEDVPGPDRAVQADAPADKSRSGAPETRTAAQGQDAAGDAGDTCEVPSYLLTSDAELPKVADAIKARRLDILVVGGGSSQLAGPDGANASYPARLEAALRERLSGIAVNVATVPQFKKTAADVAPGLENLAKERKPTLIIWQTGTIDALRAVDPDDFRAAVDSGLAALAEAGTDVVVMNLQYSPRMETMISVGPYLDNLRVGAQEHGVPLFDRFSMMRYWNESGRFDLFNPSHGLGLAKRVHDCIGQALASFVIDAAHLSTEELRVQH